MVYKLTTEENSSNIFYQIELQPKNDSLLFDLPTHVRVGGKFAED